MLRVLGFLALAGAVIALLLNLLTYAGIAPLAAGQLNGLIVISAIATLVQIGRWWRDRRAGRNDGWMPAWMVLTCAAAAFYAAGTYVADRIVDGTGEIERVGNRPRLLRNGVILRELSADDVRSVELWTVRARSAYLLPFLALPGLAILFPERVRERRVPRVRARPNARYPHPTPAQTPPPDEP